MSSGTDVFIKSPGEGGLENERPDQTIYLGFDYRSTEHLGYFHKKFYTRESVDDHVQFPQFNNIT